MDLIRGSEWTPWGWVVSGNGNGYNGNGNGNEELTGLQRAFVDAWFACKFNGVEAARMAGYSGSYSTLGNVASTNLKKPKIKAAIEDRWAAHGVTGEEVIARLARWMRFDLADVLDESGEIDLQKVREQGEVVRELDCWETREGQRIRVRIEPRLEAAKEIAKHLFLDRHADDEDLIVIVDI